MPGLPAPRQPLATHVARALDAALVSFDAFHVVDWLVRRHPRPCGMRDAVMATGQHVNDVARAMSALAARGVLVVDADGVRLAPTYAAGLVEAWRRMGVDGALRRRALALAADRETAEQVVLRVSWAPPAPAADATTSRGPSSPTPSAPGARGPSRSGGPAAPAA